LRNWDWNDRAWASAWARRVARRRLIGGAASVAIHLLALSALIWIKAAPPAEPEPYPMTASLAPVLNPAQAETLSRGRAAARRGRVRPARPSREGLVLAADSEPAPPQLTADQIAGATTAESGAPGAGDGPTGGACNMVRALQAALRRDALVQAAVAGAAGRPLLVWDGDWIRGAGEDGRGLAAVREAMIWEIGFAPAACRAEPVHGLVLLTLNDGPGAARLLVGGGEWRWSDLLNPRGTGAR
jgi:hypothetical protein